MATFLDVGVLQYFDAVFAFIFVFALVFAILQKTKALGDAPSMNAIIAVVVGIFMIMSRVVIDMLNFMIPWFTVAIIFFVLLLLIFQVFGAGDEYFSAGIKDRVLRNVLIGVGIVILLASFGVVFGQTYAEKAFDDPSVVAVDGTSATTNFEDNIRVIVTNSKVLGMVILFAVAIFAVALLTGKEYV